MKKRILPFLLLYLVFCHFSIVFAQNSDKAENINIEKRELDLMAGSAILMDAKTGEILYDKDMHKKQYPASITKMMTVLLAIEYNMPDELITFSKDAIFGIERNSSHIALDVGEQITIEQASYAIMLASANEAALGVAEQIGQTIDIFSDMMNTRATQLGCKDTHFVNPNGLHNENHYTSAYDMALITKEALKYDSFREIASTVYYEIPPTNRQPETRYLYAQHKMLKKNSSFYNENCEGGKPGFTNEALNTLITFAKQGDTELIAVVLHDAGTGIYTDTQKLFDYGFQNFQTVKVFSKDNFSKSLPVEKVHGKTKLLAGNVSLSAEEDLYATLPVAANLNDLTEKTNYRPSLTAPIENGAVLGDLAIYYQDKKIASCNLFAQSAVAGLTETDIKNIDRENLWNTLKPIGIACLITLIIVFVILRVASYLKSERLRKKRRRRYYQKYRSRE